MKTKQLAQVRIYQKDRNRLAVEAKKARTTIAGIIRLILSQHGKKPIGQHQVLD